MKQFTFEYCPWSYLVVRPLGKGSIDANVDQTILHRLARNRKNSRHPSFLVIQAIVLLAALGAVIHYLKLVVRCGAGGVCTRESTDDA
jgi:hypothetical protein